MDPLELLRRKDKWFLGGGKGAIYAPPFPRHLLVPGFWDESYLADVRFSRLFTILLLDRAGRPVRLRGQIEEWRPDRLVILYEAGEHRVKERRCVLDCNAWVSELEILSEEPLDALLWSLQDAKPKGFGAPWHSLDECDVDRQDIYFWTRTAWPTKLEPDRTAVEEEHVSGAGTMLEPLEVCFRIGSSAERRSWTVNLAQRHDDSPLWETSLLPEKFVDGKLPGEFKFPVGPRAEPDGLLHIVQHYKLMPSVPTQFVVAVGLDVDAADGAFEEAVAPGALERSETSWRRYFAGVPQFSSSDPYLTNAYWYRWYGLRLNTVDIPGLPCANRVPEAKFSPFVTEGIGFFRNFVTYSAQAHLREVAWMHDPRLAVGILGNLGKCQRADGSLAGHNYSCRPSRDFYHADFATGAERLEGLHVGALQSRHVQTLRSYAVFLNVDKRGPWGTCAVNDQNETGQEYMSRYQFASADADQWQSFTLGGVDATLYAFKLNSFLARQNAEFASPATEYHDAMLRLWDAESHFFADVIEEAVSPAHPATGLYAFLAAEFCAGEYMAAAQRWLLNPKEFWLPKGFPATAASDATFSPDGEWKEQRLNCPWSGRSWPMVNSHLVDALASVARMTQDGELKEKAGQALMKAITLMFHDGDPARPNSYEHYNPITGVPALYRGYDDYMHSWIVDLILRYAVGVQPGQDTVSPLSMDVDWVECRDIPHRDGRMHVRIERGKEPDVRIEALRP